MEGGGRWEWGLGRLGIGGCGSGAFGGAGAERGGHGILVALHWEAAGGGILRSPTLPGSLEPTLRPFGRGSPGAGGPLRPWRWGWHCSGGHSASDTLRRLFLSMNGRVRQRVARCGTTKGLPEVEGRRTRGVREYTGESMKSTGAGSRSGRRAYASVRSHMRDIPPAPNHPFPDPPDR